jgi:chemotaxis protein CheZ
MADDSGDSEDLQGLFDSVASSVKAPPPPPVIEQMGDSADLQNLFDSIAGSAPPPAPPAPAINPMGDSADLQALFDSVAAETVPENPAEAHDAMNEAVQDAVYNNLGKMARQLHDSLRELGYDQSLQEAAQQIPDARQRLAYIAQMTEQAASKVLNATDIAMPITEELSSSASTLAARWDKMFANQLSVDEFKALAADSRAYFGAAPDKLAVTNKQLTEIMMAQDFQDLTGQVIKKVVEMAQNFEHQLLKVLVEAMPEARKTEVPDGLMNGPVINAVGRDDIVTDQSQVDDLLESLGF